MIEQILLELFESGILIMFFMYVFPVILGLYIYISWAYMDIGRKARIENPGLAWIPFIGPMLVVFIASEMHWWPWLLSLVAVFVSVVAFVASPVFIVYSIIWKWKTFEFVKKPGWWAILTLIPIINLVIIGIVAWGD